MFTTRKVNLLVVIIAVVALPSVAALAWHYFTDDPTLRPLGITKADLVKQDATGSFEVIAHVFWDSRAERQSSSAFTQSLVKAFNVKGVDLNVFVTESATNGTTVLFQVGASRIGPYPKDAAVKGVNAAVTAHHMLAAGDR